MSQCKDEVSNFMMKTTHTASKINISSKGINTNTLSKSMKMIMNRNSSRHKKSLKIMKAHGKREESRGKNRKKGKETEQGQEIRRDHLDLGMALVLEARETK